MYKNSSTLLINSALWHYLCTKHWDFRHENNSTPEVLIEEILYGMHIKLVNTDMTKSLICIC